MRYDSFGDFEVFRPRVLTERSVLAEEESHFLASTSPGTYRNAQEINAAIQALCKFYTAKLETNLAMMASRGYVEFLLSQYDQSFKIEMASRGGKLSEHDSQRWNEVGRVFRRALKYLLERVCSLEPLQEPALDGEDLLWATEVVQICAEEFVQLCILSDSTYSVFPAETQLTVFPAGSEKLYLLEVVNERALQMQERIDIDGLNRSRCMEGRSIDRDLQAQNEYLGEAFLNAHGIDYEEAINVLGHLVDSVDASEGPFNIQFFHKDELLSSFSNGLNISGTVLEKVFSGFTITADRLNEDRTVIWNPKRTHRAYRRALFEIPHADGVCLAWCQGMAHEALETLIQGVVFQQFPDEWRTTEIELALAKLDNDRGKWFEKAVARNLASLGTLGRTSLKDVIGQHLRIPAGVGELDYLGYLPAEKRLILIECKMTQWTSEPKLWRDDLGKFLNEQKGFAYKFRNKREWVIQNVAAISGALSAELQKEVSPERLSHAMITFYPNIASCFIDDFPCVSLAELVIAMEASRSWPYEVGSATVVI